MERWGNSNSTGKGKWQSEGSFKAAFDKMVAETWGENYFELVPWSPSFPFQEGSRGLFQYTCKDEKYLITRFGTVEQLKKYKIGKSFINSGSGRPSSAPDGSAAKEAWLDTLPQHAADGSAAKEVWLDTLPQHAADGSAVKETWRATWRPSNPSTAADGSAAKEAWLDTLPQHAADDSAAKEAWLDSLANAERTSRRRVIDFIKDVTTAVGTDGLVVGLLLALGLSVQQGSLRMDSKTSHGAQSIAYIPYPQTVQSRVLGTLEFERRYYPDASARIGPNPVSDALGLELDPNRPTVVEAKNLGMLAGVTNLAYKDGEVYASWGAQADEYKHTRAAAQANFVLVLQCNPNAFALVQLADGDKPYLYEVKALVCWDTPCSGETTDGDEGSIRRKAQMSLQRGAIKLRDMSPMGMHHHPNTPHKRVHFNSDGCVPSDDKCFVLRTGSRGAFIQDSSRGLVDFVPSSASSQALHDAWVDVDRNEHLVHPSSRPAGAKSLLYCMGLPFIPKPAAAVVAGGGGAQASAGGGAAMGQDGDVSGTAEGASPQAASGVAAGQGAMDVGVGGVGKKRKAEELPTGTGMAAAAAAAAATTTAAGAAAASSSGGTAKKASKGDLRAFFPPTK